VLVQLVAKRGPNFHSDPAKKSKQGFQKGVLFPNPADHKVNLTLAPQMSALAHLEPQGLRLATL